MKKGVMIFWAMIIGVIVLAVLASFMVSTRPNKLEPFAACIKDSGAIFYGAFWCPHCQKQKGMFGSAAKLLPYVECSTPDGQGQLQICIDKKVVSYPTWEFPDGTILTGEQPLQVLAEKTGCELP